MEKNKQLKVGICEKLKGLRASKDKSKKLNRKQNYWLKSRITDDIYPQFLKMQ